METLHTTKIVKVGNSLSVVIPSELIKALGWQRGDILAFGCAGDSVLFLKHLSDVEVRALKPDPIINLN